MDAYAYYLLCFLLFVALAYRPISKFLKSFLDEKITEIKWNLESSINAKNELAKELAQLKKDLPFSHRNHEVMINSAEKEISAIYDSRCKDFKGILKFSEKTSIQRISQMEKQAITSIKAELLEKSISIVSKYFADQPNSELDLAIVSSGLKRQKG